MEKSKTEKIIELCSRVCFQKMPPRPCGVYPYFMPICNTSKQNCYDTLGEICEILSDEIDEYKKNMHEKIKLECEEENEKMRHILSAELPEYLRKLNPNE
jgi:hypothetical protein